VNAVAASALQKRPKTMLVPVSFSMMPFLGQAFFRNGIFASADVLQSPFRLYMTI
jgi:hypothetical protein